MSLNKKQYKLPPEMILLLDEGVARNLQRLVYEAARLSRVQALGEAQEAALALDRAMGWTFFGKGRSRRILTTLVRALQNSILETRNEDLR